MLMSPLLALFACVLAAPSAPPFAVQVAPFTDAVPSRGIERLTMPKADPVKGTLGNGIHPTTSIDLKGLRLNPAEGLISFWVRPAWPGNDGIRHRLVATQEAGGRRLVIEKAANGLLRAEIVTPSGRTVARADATRWQPNVWRHIAVGWISNKGRNVGLALWVDRVAADGPVTPYGVFDETAMPAGLILGDATSECDFDELIVRPDLAADERHGMVGCVYRDYFRTAPYDAIRLDLEPTRVPSDARAVAGHEKQFGLMGRRDGRWEPVVENVVRYSQWAYFDAKPLIRWSTSDPSVATIAPSGRLKVLSPGACLVRAEFHGLTATYRLSVIAADRPDLGVICIELHPRYRNDAVRNRIMPGEQTTARVRFGNFGTKALEPGAEVRFALIREVNGNYQLDRADKPETVMRAVLDRRLAPGEETSVEFRWPFPSHRTWMKLELDPGNRIDELCEANNTIAELTDARPVQMGYTAKALRECLESRKLNHVGSFSYYDWLRAEKLRMDVMLREAVWPTTGPNGVEEAYRIDAFTELKGGNWDEEPYRKNEVYFDGGFPVNEPVDLMAIDCAIIHEFGHTMLSQPDLYGYPVSAGNVLLTDQAGKPVAGSPELPVVRGDDTLPASPGVNVACYVGYPSLMDGCQLWLHSSQAGHIMHYRGYRQDRFWGTQGRLIPTRANWLLLTDADDQPLKGAAVYVYHVSQAPVQDSGAKFFADRPKFVGNTDDEGRFVFPGETDADWDDPETDEVDGARPVWNPFGTPASDTAFTPNVWEVEGLLLLKIVSGSRTEYRFMDLTQFNDAYLSGNTVLGVYTIRTSLPACERPVEIVRKPVPEAIRKVNKAPVAVAPGQMTVRCGQEFVIDGSRSYDPEGQPLLYRWNVGEGWLMGSLSQGPTLKLTAPDQPKQLEYKLWVLDGVRSSEPAIIKVNVVKEQPQPSP
jgi:hypothetical protein